MTPHGVDERSHGALIDLPPKVADVDVDQVRQRVVFVLPHVLPEVGAAHDFTGVAHQGLENPILLGRQADRYASPHDLMAAGIEREVLHGEKDRARQFGPAQKGVEARE